MTEPNENEGLEKKDDLNEIDFDEEASDEPETHAHLCTGCRNWEQCTDDECLFEDKFIGSCSECAENQENSAELAAQATPAGEHFSFEQFRRLAAFHETGQLRIYADELPASEISFDLTATETDDQVMYLQTVDTDTRPLSYMFTLDGWLGATPETKDNSIISIEDSDGELCRLRFETFRPLDLKAI